MSTRRPAKALNMGSSESKVIPATSSNNNIKIFGLTVKEFIKKVVNFNMKKVLKVIKGFVADGLIHFCGLLEENSPIRMRCDSTEIFMITRYQTVYNRQETGKNLR